MKCAATVMFSIVALLLSATLLHAAEPGAVTIVGDLQSELTCPGDWQPDCAATHLVLDAEDAVWQGTFDIPAGSWQYKAALDDSLTVNYGANATLNGANINLDLAALTGVKFYYSHDTHWVTDNVNSVIATVAGDFQSELGCSGDYQPWCLRSWLQDPDGDGIYTFTTGKLEAGSYQCKVAHNEDWAENYGAGGVPGGANIPFTVSQSCSEIVFTYDPVSHILTIAPSTAPVQPGAVTAAGNLQDELGCPGDWQPDCAATHLSYDAEDTLWQGVFNVPAGTWEYKAALDDSWDVNYGANATFNGANIPLSLPDATDVKFFYSNQSHWVTDNVNSVIATVAGSFQSELGCSGDWQPWCLRSWLQDPDGDGVFSFSTGKLVAGSYECKVAHDEDWTENYGAGGVPGGANIPFTVQQSCSEIFFNYDPATHILSIGSDPDVPVELQQFTID